MNSNEPTSQDQQEPLDQAAIARHAGHSRRAFLFKLSLFANGIVGAVLAVPIIGYLFGPAVEKKSDEESWIDLGPLSDFPQGQTRLATYRNPITTAWDGQTGNIPCWVRRVSDSRFQIFAINCAHLGCPVRWFSESRLFLCPCHGGAYYEDGARASGPPERGLFEYQYRIDGDKLSISAGKMPTLAASVDSPQALTQIAATTSASRLHAIEKPTPRCGSCQS